MDFSASDIVGKNLTAAKNLTAYYNYPNSSSTFIVPNGQSAGTVYSWINKDGYLWWQFIDSFLGIEKYYYIKHEPDSFHAADLTNAGVKSAEEIAAEKAEAEKLEKMGPFAYYLEKWGTPIIKYAGTGLLIYGGIKLLIDANKKK